MRFGCAVVGRAFVGVDSAEARVELRLCRGLEVDADWPVMRNSATFGVRVLFFSAG